MIRLLRQILLLLAGLLGGAADHPRRLAVENRAGIRLRRHRFRVGGIFADVLRAIEEQEFAYDVCNGLANRDLSVEIERSVLAFWFDNGLAPESIEPNLQRLVAIRSRLPEYLFEKV